MPVLARYSGIVIRMYFLGAEHNPPHIHAIYGDDTAAFDIRTGEMLDGNLPPRAAGCHFIVTGECCSISRNRDKQQLT